MRDDLDPEGPSEADLDRFGGDTRPCPMCHADLYDDAEFCHVCGHVLHRETSPMGLWHWITVGLILLAFVFFMISA